ncbi:MAG: hypothetical protein H0X33_10060 [Taibaiella sp.]|nr:hypothetical protein [Taibaiella sp.]
MKRITLTILTACVAGAAFAQSMCAHKHQIFMVPQGKTPHTINKLGTDPQFGPLCHLHSTSDFYAKLRSMGDMPRYRKDVNDLFMAMGYSGVSDPAFTEDHVQKTTIPFGAIGMLGQAGNKYNYAILTLPGKENIECWKITPNNGNGCDMYFMSECGNAFYYANPPVAAAPLAVNTVEEPKEEVNMKIKVYARYKKNTGCHCCEEFGDDMMTADNREHSKIVEKKILISEKEVDHVAATDVDDPHVIVKRVYVDVDRKAYKKLKRQERREERKAAEKDYAVQ